MTNDKKIFAGLIALALAGIGTAYFMNGGLSFVNGSGTERTGSSIVATELSRATNISKGGTYSIDGTVEGTIYINTNSNDKVTLVLNNADISSTDGPAIYVENAGSVVISVPGGTSSTISVSGASSDGQEAAVFSKDDLIITGSGSLNLISEDGDGIHVNDDLEISGVELDIRAGGDGIDVNDEYVQNNANVSITSAKDGIRSGDDEDPVSEDDILISLSGGSLSIVSVDDGIDTIASITNNGTAVDITAGGGSANAATSSGNGSAGFGGYSGEIPDFGDFSGEMPDFGDFEGQIPGSGSFSGGQRPQGGFDARGSATQKENNAPAGSAQDMSLTRDAEIIETGYLSGNTFTRSSDDTSKSKGISAEGNFINYSGNVTVDSSDDGINVAGTITVKNGTLNIKSGDDAAHADYEIVIDGGNLILNAHEGLEATLVTVNDGTVDITATDDGINAAKKTDGVTPTVTINGGSVSIDMGSGDTDAIDANGNIYINGGTVSITAQSPFDYDGEGKLNGGTVYVNGSQVSSLTNQFAGAIGGFGTNGGTSPRQGSGGQFTPPGGGSVKTRPGAWG